MVMISIFIMRIVIKFESGPRQLLTFLPKRNLQEKRGYPKANTIFMLSVDSKDNHFIPNTTQKPLIVAYVRLME